MTFERFGQYAPAAALAWVAYKVVPFVSLAVAIFTVIFFEPESFWTPLIAGVVTYAVLTVLFGVLSYKATRALSR